MNSRYIFRKPIRRSPYSELRRYVLIVSALVVVIGGIGYFIYSSLHGSKVQKIPISSVQQTVVSDNQSTFTGPYFQFRDTGKWVLDKKDSTDQMFIYDKYNGQVLEHVLTIYVNQVPIPLNLEVPRVLPVRIVNDNSLQVTGVSDPCGNQYATGELHRVKELTINGAGMLCDPDSPQYKVVVSEIGGDYRLNLKTSKGTPVQFVITYLDDGLDPQPDSLLNVASSFQTI